MTYYYNFNASQQLDAVVIIKIKNNLKIIKIYCRIENLINAINKKSY
jgi:hypothetical protein